MHACMYVCMYVAMLFIDAFYQVEEIPYSS